MSVSLDAVSLSPCLSGSIFCSLLILSTSHPSSPSSLLPSGYFLTMYPVDALPLLMAILLSASSRTFPSLFPPSLSTSLPLGSPCSPGKNSFSASSPPTRTLADKRGVEQCRQMGIEHSLSRRGSGLLIPLLWVEEVEVSFDYVTSTQPLHPDDAVQPARLALPGPNGERSPPAQLTTGSFWKRNGPSQSGLETQGLL